jgi:uncharacterized protein (TIGR03083 family)
MTDQLDALRSSVERLRRLVEPLTANELRAPAYPAEWSIADVLSHLGSGAVIMGLRLRAGMSGEDLPDDLGPVWDEWNAKSPEAQAIDALEADRSLVDRLDALTDEDRAGLSISLGPMQLGFPVFLGLRLNEHALHTWDIEVTFDPTASLPTGATALVVDQLAMIVQFSGRPTPAQRDLHVVTTDPHRAFTLSLGGDAVTLTPTALTSATDVGPPDLELGADALIRLVYGRLDPDHTPAVQGAVDLEVLRRVFPGV